MRLLQQLCRRSRDVGCLARTDANVSDPGSQPRPVISPVSARSSGCAGDVGAAGSNRRMGSGGVCRRKIAVTAAKGPANGVVERQSWECAGAVEIGEECCRQTSATSRASSLESVAQTGRQVAALRASSERYDWPGDTSACISCCIYN